MQIKMSLTIYTVFRLVSAIDNTGCFTAYGLCIFLVAFFVYKIVKNDFELGGGDKVGALIYFIHGFYGFSIWIFIKAQTERNATMADYRF